MKTLCIDIGGTEIKMIILDSQGKAITQYIREPTPSCPTIKNVLQRILLLVDNHRLLSHRISVGFPGLIIKNRIKTAPNLDTSWIGVNLEQRLTKLFGKPVRVANDAVVQGYGDIRGKGVELVITLGTGVGSALFLDGKLVPNLELAHIPFQSGKTFEELLGKEAIKKHGLAKWNANLKKAIALWKLTFNFDRLYLGGGNSIKIRTDLPRNVKISKNIEGVLGGIKLW